MMVEEARRTLQSCSAHQSWRLTDEWHRGRADPAKPRPPTSTFDTLKLGQHILRWPYHYSAHEGGRYRSGTLVGHKIDKIHHHYFGG
jgi:hypothetical protein